MKILETFLTWLGIAFILSDVFGFLKIAWAFIKANKARFLAEVFIAVFSTALGFGINHFVTKATLKTCQDERQALLDETRQHQKMLDTLKFAGEIASLKTQLIQANETILFTRQKAASDSIRNLSILDAMRAVNEYHRQPTGRTNLR